MPPPPQGVWGRKYMRRATRNYLLGIKQVTTKEKHNNECNVKEFKEQYRHVDFVGGKSETSIKFYCEECGYENIIRI